MVTQETLIVALETIKKLSDSLGMDYSEVNENYGDIICSLEEAVENIDGGIYNFNVGDTIVFTNTAIESGLFSSNIKTGTIAKVIAVEGNGVSGAFPTILEILPNTSNNKDVYRQWISPVMMKESSMNISKWFTKLGGE